MFPILIILIFIRPFISSLAYPCLNITYSSILLAFLLAWIILKGLSLKEIKPLQYPLIFFVLALAASVTFSSDKINSLNELYKYAVAILLFLIVIPLPDNEKRSIINTIIISGIVIGILAIYQYFFGFKHILNYIAREKISSPFILDYLNRKRAFSPFVTPNTLAGYLILVMPLVLTVEGKKKWVIFLLLSTALFLTKSVGAIMSLFLGMLFYLCLKKSLSVKGISLLLFAAMACIFVFILRQAATSKYLAPIFSISRRIDYWQDTLEIIKRHPFAGVGIGNFNLPLTNYAHNSYLQIWAEMGIFGLISFLWIVGSIFKSGFQNINISPYKKQIAGLLTANAIFIIHNFSDFTFFLPEVAFIWWMILGIILFKKK